MSLHPPTTVGAAETRIPLIVAETALLLVHLAVVAGFARLYADGSFVWVLAGFTVGAHALAVVVRRRGVGAAPAAVLALTGAVLAATWMLFPSSAWFGLPTRETWDLAGEAVRVSRERFARVAAPAPVIPGFQLAAGLALYGAVWFADWAAFRIRATAEAMAPAAVLFVFGAVLGSGRYRLVSALVFTAAALCFVTTHRALRAQLDDAWISPSPFTGPGAVLRGGAALAVLGLVGGVVVGPRLPGSEADAIVRWRSQLRGGPRSTVSPIVDIRKRLVNQSATELFTVTADRSAYWRLTALDEFDGQLWSSGGRFSLATGRLTTTTPPVQQGRRTRQQFDILALDALWAPTAYEGRALVSTSAPMRWDPASSTLIVDADGTSNGLTYEVVSESPTLDRRVLDATGSADARDIEDRYEGLPADVPRLVTDTARSVTRGAATRYQRALALQTFFRERFTYSLDVEPGNGDAAIVDFLTSRKGYCEQFAGTYAAMARTLGIPSRVAVGFTPGDRSPDDPTRYTVRGKHAHAWPELWFPGIGWVPFEPTPGRGIPDAEYTGVPEQQDESAPRGTIQPASTTTTAPSGPVTAPAPTTPEPAPRSPTAVRATGAGGGRGPSGLAQALIGLGSVAALWLAALLLGPILRRRRDPVRSRPSAVVLAAWEDGLTPVRWLTGLRPRPAETHAEFARRASGALGDVGGLSELGELATSASWDPAGASLAEAQRAGALARGLLDGARQQERRLTRLLRRLSWREAWGRPGPARPTP